MTTSLPIEFAMGVKAALADWVAASADRPHGPLTFYVRAINSHPYDPRSEIITLRLPAVPNAPAPEPLPENLYDPERAAVEERNRRRQARHDEAVHDAKEQAVAAAELLHQIVLVPDDRATRLEPCPIKMGELGVQRLVIATDLESAGPQEPPAQLQLSGVEVFVVFRCEASALECQRRRDAWTEALSVAGASSVTVLDPSQELTNVLG